MTTAWDELSETIAAAPCPVDVLPPGPRAAECLDGLGVTTASWLGAVVDNSGGLLVDHGWLRVLGGGTDTLPDILTAQSFDTEHFLVAYDVLGGKFAWSPATMRYFAPDVLEWEDLDLGYSAWLHAMLGGALEGLYETLRWPGWQDEVAAARADQGIHLFPPPWSAEGKDVSRVSRKVVPMGELLSPHGNQGS
ncbi:DUF2625 family protein [Amycolatopsis sp. lyj-90]|uniref:DUF2625 family protein n=1 Tax=Amycolatopsis sp. lyj-90 TaxID=2789285 RepID=UPI00397CA53B